jgi:hypothetical protein
MNQRKWKDHVEEKGHIVQQKYSVAVSQGKRRKRKDP